ncbi:MAG: MnhB domain-containing protein [Haloarculaceae archaeon]
MSGEGRAETSGEERAETSVEGRAETSGEERAETSGEERAESGGYGREEPSGEERDGAAREPPQGAEEPDDGPGLPRTTRRDTTVIARTVARVVLPIILLTAIALLLQGHNRPGGGFIAAVLTAAGIGLIYIVYGLEYLETELLHRSPEAPLSNTVRREYGTAVGVGLGIAVGSGIAAVALGYPFLTQAVAFLEHLPVYGELEVASAFAFDLGVYVTVVASLLTILAVVGAE